VERAKSGRSICSACYQVIRDGHLRFGSLFERFGSYSWRHIECVTEIQKGNVYKEGLAPCDVDGYDELSAVDRGQVEVYVGLPGEGEERDALLLRMKTVPELKDMLREAGLKIGGNRPALLERLTNLNEQSLDATDEEDVGESRMTRGSRKKRSPGSSTPKRSRGRSGKGPLMSPSAASPTGRGGSSSRKRKAYTKKKRPPPTLDFEAEVVAPEAGSDSAETQYYASGRLARSSGSRKRPAKYT
jgi:hypothetical protein